MNGAVEPGLAVNARSILTVSLLSIAYLLLSIWVIGFKADQLVLVVIFNTMFYLICYHPEIYSWVFLFLLFIGSYSII